MLEPQASDLAISGDICISYEDYESKQSLENETFFKVNFAKISL